jgi:thiol-disulfide isomerase/thioredoxin
MWCPDFTAQIYEVEGDTFSLSDDTFTLSKQSGKISVINFWETWCQACIEELPAFNQIQMEYGDKVEVVAIAGVTSTADSAATWMSGKGWKTFDKESEWADVSLTFAYLPAANCQMLGCAGMLPRTIIVDGKGIVAHAQDGSMTHEALKEIVDSLL